MDRFTEFAAKTSIPSRGGPLADGRAFVQFLGENGKLAEEGRLEALKVDLRYATVHDGLVTRRLPSVRTGWSPRRFGLVMAVRIPWLGEYWWIR
jgi:hypothetical protein